MDGALNPAAFHLRASAADVSDLIIYNSGTGVVYFDIDGAGRDSAVQVRNANAGIALTEADFFIV